MMAHDFSDAVMRNYEVVMQEQEIDKANKG